MIIQSILRITQFLMATAVLAVSLTLIKANHDPGTHSPAIIGFSAFSGSFGLAAATVGGLAFKLQTYPVLVLGIVDGVAAIFALGAGLALAAYLRIGSCTNASYLSTIQHIVAPTSLKCREDESCTPREVASMAAELRCVECQALTVLLFVCFVCFLATGMLGFLRGARARRTAVF